jgi:hypothetical protein
MLQIPAQSRFYLEAISYIGDFYSCVLLGADFPKHISNPAKAAGYL